MLDSSLIPADLERIALSAAVAASERLRFHAEQLHMLQVLEKADRTKVSAADMDSHHAIIKILSTTGIPVISEEDSARSSTLQTYWLIDPLDGTDEFLRGDPDYCVLIALIHDARPILGIIGHPAERVLYSAFEDRTGVHCFNEALELEKTFLPRKSDHITKILTSKTRPDPTIARLIDQSGGWEPVSRGSALKCVDLVTEAADLYPRNARLSTWDLAAGDALLRALGGGIFDIESGGLVQYNRTDFKVPFFVASPHEKMALHYINLLKM